MVYRPDYDIPPDHYRYTINTEKHGLPPTREGVSSVPYYAGIGSKTRIFNFFNPVDSALDGWRLQQVSKPDSGSSFLDALNPTSGYFYEGESIYLFPSTVRDVYKKDEVILDWSIQDEKFEILASIIPSRTGPLGQKPLSRVGEISQTSVNLKDEFNFTKSNYDHSAQWLHAYYKRYGYWERVCFALFEDKGTCIKR